MLPLAFVTLLAVAFAGAALYNLIGSAAARDTFARLGYPAWWCRVTGALEMLTAALLAVPATRVVGLTLGSLILVAATASVLRRREFAHLAPLGLFLALTAAVVWLG
ncbi:MAG: DoxX family protein [Caulobacteraceae bacterium]|nr:DoxX family protein [Caulobacter sp.]